jgi:hypothetical protein
MSELIRVIIITIFRAFSTGSRKAVDNPAALWAFWYLVKLRWGGINQLLMDVPPQDYLN